MRRDSEKRLYSRLKLYNKTITHRYGMQIYLETHQCSCSILHMLKKL